MLVLWEDELWVQARASQLVRMQLSSWLQLSVRPAVRHIFHIFTCVNSQDGLDSPHETVVFPEKVRLGFVGVYCGLSAVPVVTEPHQPLAAYELARDAGLFLAPLQSCAHCGSVSPSHNTLQDAVADAVWRVCNQMQGTRPASGHSGGRSGAAADDAAKL